MFTKFIDTARRYNFNKLRHDFSAALTVAAIAIPQNMAYALIAGVSPIYGLYTSIVSMLAANIFGFSSYMIVGPTNVMAMAIASSLGFLQDTNYLEAVFLLTFLVGIIQIVLGLLKLGNLVNYVSRSVIKGLITGVAVLIAVNQLTDLLGIELESSSNVFTEIYNISGHLHLINNYSLLFGILTISIILILKKFAPQLPAYLLALFSVMLICYLFPFAQLNMVRSFTSTLPRFRPVNINFDLMQRLTLSALSLALLGFIQTMSIVRALEKREGDPVNLNEEFIGQGIVNLICSFFNSFAITGSFTNSFANYMAGARTKFSQLITGTIILLFVLILKPFVSYIPMSSLAGMVILISLSMIDFKEILQTFKTTRFDAIIFLTTFITTISTPRLDYAIFFGILISFILVLKNTSEINYNHFSLDEEDKFLFQERDIEEVKENKYIIINLAGTLHFNSAENLKEKLNESFREDKIFVIRWREVENIDVTTIEEVEKFIDRVHRNDGEVMFCGLNEELYSILRAYGLINKIGKENVFKSKDFLFSSTKDAIQKADNKELKN